ncbi:hypothetical protein Aperf_G00000129709 [Anoplocephala perfoliata]
MSLMFKSFLAGLLEKDARRRLQWPELLSHPFVADLVYGLLVHSLSPQLSSKAFLCVSIPCYFCSITNNQETTKSLYPTLDSESVPGEGTSDPNESGPKSSRILRTLSKDATGRPELPPINPNAAVTATAPKAAALTRQNTLTENSAKATVS